MPSFLCPLRFLPAAEDSSDDDEPLIKMIKKSPTDEQLKETVQSLLKEANLEEMTMKQICQRVTGLYADALHLMEHGFYFIYHAVNEWGRK